MDEGEYQYHEEEDHHPHHPHNHHNHDEQDPDNGPDEEEEEEDSGPEQDEEDEDPHHSSVEEAADRHVQLPTEAELVLLCLDYLRDLPRSFSSQALLQTQGLQAEYITLACWALTRAFCPPPLSNPGNSKSTTANDDDNDAADTHVLSIAPYSKENHKTKKTKSSLSKNDQDDEDDDAPLLDGNDAWFDAGTHQSLDHVQQPKHFLRMLNTRPVLHTQQANVLPSLGEMQDELLYRGTAAQTNPSTGEWMQRNPQYNNTNNTTNDKDQENDDDDAAAHPPPPAWISLYDYDDYHASNRHRFYPLQGLASGSDLPGPLSLGELVAAGLVGLNAQTRRQAEADFCRPPDDEDNDTENETNETRPSHRRPYAHLFQQYQAAVYAKGFFDDLEADPTLTPRHKQALFQERHAKIVTKFRHKLASTVALEDTKGTIEYLAALTAAEQQKQGRTLRRQRAHQLYPATTNHNNPNKALNASSSVRFQDPEHSHQEEKTDKDPRYSGRESLSRWEEPLDDGVGSTVGTEVSVASYVKRMAFASKLFSTFHPDEATPTTANPYHRSNQHRSTPPRSKQPTTTPNTSNVKKKLLHNKTSRRSPQTSPRPGKSNSTSNAASSTATKPQPPPSHTKPHRPTPISTAPANSLSVSTHTAATTAVEDLEQAERCKATGNAHMQRKEYEAAAACYTKALDLSSAGPQSHVYFSNRAAALVSLRHFEEAIADSERALALQPDYSKAHARLGLAQFLLGNYAEAQHAYTTALRLEPHNASNQSYLEKATKRLEQQEQKQQQSSSNRTGAAKSSSKQSSSSSSAKEAEKCKTKGNALMANREYEKALGAYTQALQCSSHGPQSHVYYSNRAAALCYLERYGQAEQDSLAALELDPTYGKAHARLGLSRFFLHNYAGAIAAYTTALEYDPDNAASQSYLQKAKSRLARQQQQQKSRSSSSNAKSSSLSVSTRPSSATRGAQATSPTHTASPPNASHMDITARQLLHNDNLRSMATKAMDRSKSPDAVKELLNDPQMHDLSRKALAAMRK